MNYISLITFHWKFYWSWLRSRDANSSWSSDNAWPKMAHAHLNCVRKWCPDKIWYQKRSTYCPQFLLKPFSVSLIESGLMLCATQKKPHIMSFQERTIIPQGPVPRKMVKFNPGLSQISSTVFSSKNMQLEVTKCCWAFTKRYSNDNTKCYPKQRIGM